MEGNRVRKVSAFIAAAALVATAGTASAQITKEEAGCRAAIQKNSQKLGSTVNKTVDGCWKSVLGGKIAANTVCNSMAADGKGKIAGAIGKVGPGVDKKCVPADVPTLIATSYPNCPSPADGADAGGATTGVDTFAELSACEVDINSDAVFTLRDYILRPNAAAILAHPNVKGITACVNAIAKGATGIWNATSKERGKCQATSDKAAGPYAYGCSTFDANGKIAGAVTKLADGITKSCAPLSAAELGLVGTCSTSTAANGILACVSNAAKKNASGATAAAFEFAGVCPSEVQVSVRSGTGGGAVLSSTALDAGWTGFGHDADVVDGFKARVNLSCSSNDCSSCTVTSNCDEGNCRCSNDPTIVCSTPFVAGGPCGAGTCEVHFGPPLALAAGGVATCVTNIIKTELVGTADAGTGESNTVVNNIAKVHTGGTATQLVPCPTCSGATIGAVGTCAGGENNGDPCTTNAVNPTFGNTSYDCPPATATNVTGAGLKIDLTLTDGVVSLPFGDSCDAPLGALACACGGCSLDPLKACKVDADCVGFGTCNNAGGPPRQPNGCADLTCNADGAGTGEGTCNAGPDDTYCDGKTKASGEGYVTCLTNADCGPAVGGGTCSLTKQRDCYLNPITADGVAGIDGAELVSTFCSGPTTSASVNSAGGIPGAGRVRLEFNFNGLCSDGVTPYELGGSNCP